MIEDIALTDTDLVHLLRQGDRVAFTQIYDRYWKRLFSTAYKRLRNKEQCQDIVQVVMSDLWRRRSEVNIENLSAYLHSAVRFQVLNQVSRNPYPCDFLDEFNVLLESPVRADNDLIEKQTLQLVKLWIDALPEKRRTIFLMYVNEDLSTREIASRLGITQKTVQNQLNTAVTMLRSRLAQLFTVMILASFHLK